MAQNKTKFSILAPRSKYGNVMAAIFKKIVKDRDGIFVTSEFYKPTTKSLSRAVNRVVNAFVIDPKIEINNDTVIEEKQREYAEVIMIPESGNILNKIIETIQKQNTNEREFQILGSSNWDDISTLKNYNLNGSWFAAPDNEKFQKFEKQYYRYHGKFPPRIASIAYDLVLALSIIIEENHGQIVNAQDLINYEDKPQNGFRGIDGLFRFLPNGLVQRNLAVLEVDNGRFRTLEDAGDRFLRY
ncbi:MAG: penicillin-binding protein activator [Rickettsiales bacterium]|nr:penicillin-binding protein activator [Rickettsiales bacterium]